MNPPFPNDPSRDHVVLTHLPAMDRTSSRGLALGASLLIYSAAAAGLAFLGRSPVPRPLPPRYQAILLQDDAYAPPPPPPAGRRTREATPQPTVRPQPEVPQETPRILPQEPLRPRSGPSPEPGLPGGSPGGLTGGIPGGVPGGLPGGIPGGSPGSTLVPPRFDAAYLRNPAPDYPVFSRRLGEEGRVILRVLVDPEGRAQQLEIKASSGFPRLDRVALDTVRRWRFIPARHGDLPTVAWVLVPVTFQLEA